MRCKPNYQQECIPVGCAPPAAVAVTGGSPHTHTRSRPPQSRQSPPRAGTPLEQAPPQSPEQTPSPSRHPLARSPSTSPLAVGLDQIPLNFPLGCGPGPDPPQLPPWLWAWRPPKTCCKACWDTTYNACWDSTDPPPPVDRMTDTCKNMTFANFVCGR